MTTKTAKTPTKTAPKLRPKHVGSMALWICTPFGVLMPSERPANHTPAGDTRTLQVRARRAEYLTRFRELYCPGLGKNEHFPKQDYPWKAYVTPEDLARAVARMVLDTDSEVFKPLAEGPKGLPGRLGRDLHECYTSMWSTQLSRLSDGTSSYDKGGYADAGTIRACRRMGHFWPPRRRTCVDCGEPNPSYPKAGPYNVFPPGYPKITKAGPWTAPADEVGAAKITRQEGDEDVCAECGEPIELTSYGEWDAYGTLNGEVCDNSASGLHEPEEAEVPS